MFLLLLNSHADCVSVCGGDKQPPPQQAAGQASGGVWGSLGDGEQVLPTSCAGFSREHWRYCQVRFTLGLLGTKPDARKGEVGDRRLG